MIISVTDYPLPVKLKRQRTAKTNRPVDFFILIFMTALHISLQTFFSNVLIIRRSHRPISVGQYAYICNNSRLIQAVSLLVDND